jgi:hypothetical protein
MERIGISIFLSLVITSIVGLILVQIEHFLNMRHVSLVLVVITLVILLPLYYIRIKEKRTYVLFSNATLNKIFILITILAIIAVISSGVLVSTGNLNNNNESEKLFAQGNTTFEVTGIHETPDSEGYYNFTNEEELNLTVNIQNDENKDMNYRLKIDIINDTENTTFSDENITVKATENLSGQYTKSVPSDINIKVLAIDPDFIESDTIDFSTWKEYSNGIEVNGVVLDGQGGAIVDNSDVGVDPEDIEEDD